MGFVSAVEAAMGEYLDEILDPLDQVRGVGLLVEMLDSPPAVRVDRHALHEVFIDLFYDVGVAELRVKPVDLVMGHVLAQPG